jgi:hypothetical protein
VRVSTAHRLADLHFPRSLRTVRGEVRRSDPGWVGGVATAASMRRVLVGGSVRSTWGSRSGDARSPTGLPRLATWPRGWSGGGQQRTAAVGSGVQARTNCGVVEDRDVGGDQRDGFPAGEQDGQVGAQQLSPGSGCGVWGVVVLDVGDPGWPPGLRPQSLGDAGLGPVGALQGRLGVDEGGRRQSSSSSVRPPSRSAPRPWRSLDSSTLRALPASAGGRPFPSRPPAARRGVVRGRG